MARTSEVEEVDSSSEPLEQTHVDENACGVELDVRRVLGALVGVVELVGRQQELHQSVGHVGLGQRAVVPGFEGDTGDRLQDEAEQMLP